MICKIKYLRSHFPPYLCKFVFFNVYVIHLYVYVYVRTTVHCKQWYGSILWRAMDVHAAMDRFVFRPLTVLPPPPRLRQLAALWLSDARRWIWSQRQTAHPHRGGLGGGLRHLLWPPGRPRCLSPDGLLQSRVCAQELLVSVKVPLQVWGLETL